ncbi:MAG: hypothetical protein GSR85_01455 [Desulfurococcales archaeon]|nr:hypothetical protein [Desulfurococcales archaeon]
MNPKHLIFLSVTLDAISTHLTPDLPESRLLARMLLSSLGALYWLVELLALYILFIIIVIIIVSRYTLLSERYAAFVVAAAPWVAAWRNLGVILRLAVGVW